MGARRLGDHVMSATERTRRRRARLRAERPPAGLIRMSDALYRATLLAIVPDRTLSRERCASIFAEFRQIRFVPL
jgi:hypothetical protein